MAAEKRVNPQVEVERDADEAVTTMSGLMTKSLPEVEVDPVSVPTRQFRGVPMVTVRVNDDIEDMSYVHSGTVERYTFEYGKQYEIPWYIAAELEDRGKIWH